MRIVPTTYLTMIVALREYADDWHDRLFWRCVREEVRPDRGLPEAPAETLPADLAYLLIHRVGMPERQVAELTKDQAIKILTEYWSASPRRTSGASS